MAVAAVIGCIGSAVVQPVVSYLVPKIGQCLRSCLPKCFPCCRLNGDQTDAGQAPGKKSNSRPLGDNTNDDRPPADNTNGGRPLGDNTNDDRPPEDNTNGGRPPRESMNGGLIIDARDLEIEHSKNPEYWKWIEDPRFTEVAELLEVWFFHIKTSINFLGLSANTKYGAYLIFKIEQNSEGLDAILNTSVSVGRKQDKKFVCLKPTSATPASIGRPQERSDGWLELELGNFDCDIVTDKDAVIIMKETKRMDKKKTGLTIAGVEIRPI